MRGSKTSVESYGDEFLLTMFTYPYIFLITSASLRKMNHNFEEVARSQGMSAAGIFRKVNLPFLQPTIGAGAILISLYVLYAKEILIRKELNLTLRFSFFSHFRII